MQSCERTASALFVWTFIKKQLSQNVVIHFVDCVLKKSFHDSILVLFVKQNNKSRI